MSEFDLTYFLKNLPSEPGVYRMLDQTGKIIYVGKAKRLDRRVKSYFQKKHEDTKTQKLVERIAKVEITVTQTEYEALILESNLIKQHRPKYNIIFRDDKSYPFVFISKGDFPRVVSYRGARKPKGNYLGPFPDMRTLRENLNLLQKVFQFRQCEDSTFNHRTRPCLQYQIKRCTAPCVGYISPKDYQQDIAAVKAFLEGKNQSVIAQLEQKMVEASDALDFEQAARFRDQIQSLQRLRTEQSVYSAQEHDVDVIVLARQAQLTVITLLIVRHGQALGTRDFWPKHSEDEGPEAVLAAFLEQYYGIGYGAQSVPKQVLVNYKVAWPDVLLSHFANEVGHVPTLLSQVRGERAKWLKLTEMNAQKTLSGELNKHEQGYAQFQLLTQELKLPEVPNRIECFDISHTQGQQTVASCVVHGPEGALKKQYRRFNIEGVTPGDDYAALHQAITRRYKRMLQEEKPFPGLVIIDGGRYQLQQAVDVWAELSLPESTTLISVAKGESRKAGLEVIWRDGYDLPLVLPEDSAALHLIQRVRDEAHRFAITGHQKKREKQSLTSRLREVPGVGPKRAKALLSHFGGWQALSSASVEQVANVPGVSRELAQEVLGFIRSM